MSSFTDSLKVEVLDNGREYRLLESFIYFFDEDYEKYITIPQGYITDFATTPRFFWSVLPPFGKYTKSCVLHDFLCQKAKQGEITRFKADSLFLQSMEAVKVPKWQKWILYYGVRIYAIARRIR